MSEKEKGMEDFAAVAKIATAAIALCARRAKMDEPQACEVCGHEPYGARCCPKDAALVLREGEANATSDGAVYHDGASRLSERSVGVSVEVGSNQSACQYREGTQTPDVLAAQPIRRGATEQAVGEGGQKPEAPEPGNLMELVDILRHDLRVIREAAGDLFRGLRTAADSKLSADLSEAGMRLCGVTRPAPVSEPAAPPKGEER